MKYSELLKKKPFTRSQIIDVIDDDHRYDGQYQWHDKIGWLRIGDLPKPKKNKTNIPVVENNSQDKEKSRPIEDTTATRKIQEQLAYKVPDIILPPEEIPIEKTEPENITSNSEEKDKEDSDSTVDEQKKVVESIPVLTKVTNGQPTPIQIVRPGIPPIKLP